MGFFMTIVASTAEWSDDPTVRIRRLAAGHPSGISGWGRASTQSRGWK